MFDVFKKLMFARQIQIEKGSLIILGQRMLILPALTFVYLQKVAPNKELMNKFIYYSCKLADVKGFASGIREKYGLTEEKLTKWMFDVAMLAGWGQFDLLSIDKEKLTMIFHVKNSPVSILFKHSTSPVDHAIRGFIAGASETLYKKPIDTIEIKCQGMGDQYCEFITKPTKEFDFNDSLVKSQLDIKGVIAKEIKKIK